MTILLHRNDRLFYFFLVESKTNKITKDIYSTYYSL